MPSTLFLAAATFATSAPATRPFAAEGSRMVFGRSDFYVGWGTLALVNAGLAQSKNRSGLAWFLISMLLGPIATFILVVFCERVEE